MKFFFFLIFVLLATLLYFSPATSMLFVWIPIPFLLVLIGYLRLPFSSSLLLAIIAGFLTDLHGMIIGPTSILYPTTILFMNQMRETVVTTFGFGARITTIATGMLLYCVGLPFILMLLNGFNYYAHVRVLYTSVIIFFVSCIACTAADGVLRALARLYNLYAKRSV